MLSLPKSEYCIREKGGSMKSVNNLALISNSYLATVCYACVDRIIQETY